MTTREDLGFEPDYAIAPGETLRESMEALGMTQAELALRTSLTVQTISRIFKGTQPISIDTANRLELATGIIAKIWNNLEAQYREQLAKIEERERFIAHIGWLKEIPVKELQQRGYISDITDKALILREALKFYGVSSVSAWMKIWETPAVASRRSPCFDTHPGNASAWIRMGEVNALKVKCEEYDANRFKSVLKTIRLLTTEKPDVFIPEMSKLCAGAGVACSFVREMKKVPWSGATEWLSPNKVMILLSLRGKANDKFWFSFFHEAGHVLHDNKKDLLINDGTNTDPREIRANDFASEFLIPQQFNDEIKSSQSGSDIGTIAKKLHIAPCIVAGRYQFLTNHWNKFNSLKAKYIWSENQN